MKGISSEFKEKSRSLRDLLRDYERVVIMKALQATGGNVHRAADGLGIRRESLFRRIRSFKIDLLQIRALSGDRKP